MFDDAGRRKAAKTKRERSKEKILAAAVHTLSEQGVVGFTVAKVAETSGLSQATLYRYFPDRQTLILEALLRSEGTCPTCGRQIDVGMQ